MYRLKLAIIPVYLALALGLRHAIAADTTRPSTGSSPLTLITVHMSDATPDDVLREISRQANVPIRQVVSQLPLGNAPPINSISLDFDEAPFWSVMASYCNLTRTIPIARRDASLDLAPISGASNDLGGIMYASGLFSVVAAGIGRDHKIDLLSGAHTEADGLNLIVYSDPKASMSGSIQASLDVARDELGNSLVGKAEPIGAHSATEPAAGSVDGYAADTWMVRTRAPMRLDAPWGHLLTRVHGSISVQVVGARDEIRMDDAAHSAGQTISKSGRTVTIEGIKGSGASYVIHFKYTRDSATNATQSRIDAEVQGFQALDADGKFLHLLLAIAPPTANSVELYVNLGNVIGSTFPGARGGPFSVTPSRPPAGQSAEPIKQPIRLEWKFVTKVRTITAPFEFTDLPLPPP